MYWKRRTALLSETQRKEAYSTRSDSFNVELTATKVLHYIYILCQVKLNCKNTFKTVLLRCISQEKKKKKILIL